VAIFRWPVEGEAPEFVLHGPVVVGAWDPMWMGAGERTNNCAELSAVGETMLWLLHEAPDEGNTPVHIRYDSTYAANLAQGVWTPKANELLAARVRELTEEVERTRVVTWEWVRGHQGEHDNEIADRAAAAGAEGRISAQSRRWTEPRLPPPPPPAPAGADNARTARRRPAAAPADGQRPTGRQRGAEGGVGIMRRPAARAT
jgi:ribonuclease HI